MGLLDFFKSDWELQWKAFFTNDLILPTQMDKHFAVIAPKNIPVSVQLGHNPLLYKSYFEGISKDRTVLLDTLIPMAGNQKIKNNRRVIISYAIDGVQYSFKGSYLGTILGKYESINISFPRKIARKQQREFYRVETTYGNPVGVEFGKGAFVKVLDISLEGLLCYTDKNLEGFKEKEVPMEVSLVFPAQGESFKVKAVVCQFKVDELMPNGEYLNKCALQFTSLKESQSQIISNYVMERQREIILETT